MHKTRNILLLWDTTQPLIEIHPLGGLQLYTCIMLLATLYQVIAIH
jgi:hypothetical protein